MNTIIKPIILNLSAITALFTISIVPAQSTDETSSQYCVSTGMFTNENSTVFYDMFSSLSTDQGQSWSVPTQFASEGWFVDLKGVSCTDYGQCMAVGTEGGGSPIAYVSKDYGNTWSLRKIPVTGHPDYYQITDVSCTQLSCVVAGLSTDPYHWGPYAFMTFDLGASWQVTSLPPVNSMYDSPYDLSCNSYADCLIVGESLHSGGGYQPLVYSGRNGGYSWSRDDRLVNMGAKGTLRLVNCQNEQCIVIGQLTSEYGYATTVYNFDIAQSLWTMHDVPSPLGINAIDCSPDLQSCVIVGTENYYGGPVSHFTEDGGKTWTKTTHTFPVEGGSAFNLYDVSCAGADENGYCVALGRYVYYPIDQSYANQASIFLTSNDWGKTWAPPVFPTPIEPIVSQLFAGVSCR
jgi:hypothetical protein